MELDTMCILRKLLILIVFMSGCGGGDGENKEDDSWVWRNPLPSGNNLNDVAWNGSLLVAVGDNGTILTSADAQQWEQQDSGELRGFKAVIWAGDRFIAVGGNTRQPLLVASSVDGLEWITLDTNIDSIFPLEDVVWDGSQFIAVGCKKVIGSEDGVEWNLRLDGELDTDCYKGVEWTGEQFVAVGGNIKPHISISADGMSWSHVDTTSLYPSSAHGIQPQAFGIEPQPQQVVWTGDQLVAVGSEGLVITSSDGISWTVQDSGTTQLLTSLTWTGAKLIATQHTGTVHTSYDGVSWESFVIDSSRYINGAAFTGEDIVLVGSAGSIVLLNEDFSVSEYGTSVSYSPLTDVVWNGTRYIAIGTEVLSSSDGIVWERESVNLSSYLWRAIWAGDRFFAVGDEGLIVSSPDGSEWTHHEISAEFPERQILYDIAWSGSRFVAVGDNWILTSLDGEDWTIVEHPEFFLYKLTNILWTGSEFIGFGNKTGGDGDVAISSVDGLSWTVNQRTLNDGEEFQSTEYLYSVAYNGEQFVALDHNIGEFQDYIYTSSDGIRWFRHEHGIARNLRGIHWTGIKYIAVGDGVIASSLDGVTWHEETAMTSQRLYGAASSGQQVVVVGEGGSIISTSK
ncbi:MAG: hypothetical protein AB2551_14830 [Candidatus Thiodiazotropha sp.]